jgi:hypothetical protein
VFEYFSKFPAIANIRVDYVDLQNHIMHLSNKLSLWTWGENITISFYDTKEGRTRIVVRSAPALPINIFDFGRNRKNVESIKRHILSLYGG